MSQHNRALLFIFFLASSTQSFAQPANDNFANATVLTNLSNWLSAPAAYTNVASTADGTAPGCTDNRYNVWFKFQATTTDLDLRAFYGGANGTANYVIASLYAATGTPIQCNYPATAGVGVAVVRTTSLVVGDWYYFSVSTHPATSSYNGTFRLYINDVVDFDFFARAVELTNLSNWSSADAAYTSAGATAGGTVGSCASINKNVWFKFQATTNEIEVRILTGGTKGTQGLTYLTLYNASGSPIQCNYSGSGTYSFIQNTSLVTGDWYYFSVDTHATGTAGTFTVTIKDNIGFDLMSKAVLLSNVTNYTSSNAQYTTDGATPDGSGGTCASPYRNVWFKFQAASTEIDIKVFTGGVKGTLRFGALTFYNNGTPITCYVHQVSGDGTMVIQNTSMTVGAWYYFSVDAPWFATSGTFTLVVNSSVNFDSKLKATEVTSTFASANAAYSNNGATGDVLTIGCAYRIQNVWFKFQATTTRARIRVWSGGAKGTIFSPWVVLLNSSNTQLGCATTTSGVAQVEAYTLTVGQWYWFSVDSNIGQGGTFTVEMTDGWKELINQFCFQYKYDGRQRMTHKKVPGADWVYMVYDDRDRVVLTQDGNQRPNKLWSFTKYDELNRPILTGIKDTTVVVSQETMQGVVNHYYTAFTVAKWGEGRGTTVHGYTNLSYPKLTDPHKYLTVTYYDDYTWKNTLLDSARLSFKGDDLEEQESNNFKRLTGLATGGKVKVLDGDTWGGSTWLVSCSYYDDKLRAIQTVSDNYKGGTDRTTMVLDFTGKTMRTRTTHENYDVTWKDRVAVNVIGGKVVSTNTTAAYGLAGIGSVETLSGDGWVEVIVGDLTTVNTKGWVVGFSSANTNANINTIQYGVGVSTAGQVVTNEGATATNKGTAVYGDVLKVSRTGSTITFYRNGTLMGTAGTTSSATLMVDAGLYTSPAAFSNVRTSFTRTTQHVTRRFEYDHAGRLVKTWHTLNDGDSILLATNDYNELGQLIDKKLHSTDDGITGKQSIDYRYNIRGWLTSMNGAELGENEKNDDGSGQQRDLLGLDLLYQQVEGGLSNSALFNGNISAMKWSNNLGLGTVKQNAYKYGYDTLNRIKSASFVEKTSAWQTNTSQMYNESGYTYDLNGNILSLTRNGKTGSGMDVLAYDYGTGMNRSNQLLKVTDTGDKTKGFVDWTNTSNDYGYDLNGSMLYDLNKGINTATTPMKYNHLNLPEYLNRGGNTIRYIYDATGRKLAQSVVFMGVGDKRTDYCGEFEYENDVLKFVNTEEGRITLGEHELIYSNSGESVSTVTTVSSTVTAVTMNGEKYIKVIASNSTSGAGLFPIGGSTAVQAGERYLLRARGYQSGGYVAYIQAKVNGTNVDWPFASIANRDEAEAWTEQAITIPANGTLQAGVTWPTVSQGQILYLNEFEVVKLTNNSNPEYQYHLKDHLGNVRMTFTTKKDIDEAVATLETDSVLVDQSNFLRYDLARRVKSFLFDHTNDNAADSIGYSQRLNGSEDERIGLAKSLSVMPGDVINAEVYAKYVDPEENDWEVALTTLMGWMASPGTAPTGTIIDGSGYASSNLIPLGITPVGHENDSENDIPKAYLNYVFINRNFDISSIKIRYVRITEAGSEDGSDGPHDYLTLGDTIQEAGYVYVYLSNDGEEVRDVYFDDFKVEHVKSPVIQSDDYYPFGLRYNSYSRENSLINKSKLFQGQEHIDDLGLNWDNFKWRNHMPDIGRFFNVDPLAEKYAYNSPYAFSENHVTTHVELEGLEKVSFMAALVTPHKEVGHKVDNGGGVYVTKTEEVNKNFGEVNEYSGQSISSTINTGTGEQSNLNTFEASHVGGFGDEMMDTFGHLDAQHFDHDQSTKKAENGSVITGQIEGTEFTINVGVSENNLTFDATIKGGDTDKAFAIKVNGITISFGQGGRNSDGEVKTRAVVPYKMDSNGNAVIDANYHSKAQKDDEKTDTQKKN